MGQMRDWYFLLVVFCLFPASSGWSSSNIDANSLNSIIRDHAFRAFARGRTGVVYKVPLPANFSGMEASIIRLRSRSLWIRGANFSKFQIPPRVISLPYVRRLALVYQNLGSWSSSYYNVSGYSLASPISGLLAYDASNLSSSPTTISQLDLRVKGDPISVRFSELALPKGMIPTKRCAGFGPDGSLVLGEVKSTNVCLMTGTGHFSIVVPLVAPGPGSAEEPGREDRKWKIWVGVCAGGVVGLVLGGLVGIGLFKLFKNKKMEKMKKKAEEGEVLETVWVGGSKMPSAAMIRTHPVLENGNTP